jgi:hypothetical protein
MLRQMEVKYDEGRINTTMSVLNNFDVSYKTVIQQLLLFLSW